VLKSSLTESNSCCICYSWDDSNVKDLLSDINKLFEDEDGIYSIAIESREKGAFGPNK